ncbi:MAG: phospholipase D family protein, partial [Elusimicrobia bacterium]|nr:phospholipase D family protein [Elusimicrobiota bacterium]
MKPSPHSFFLSLAAALFLSASAAARSTPVEFVPGDRYFDTLTGLVARSTASVVAYVYLYSLTPLHAESLPVRLADALGAAAARGVRVEVVFNSLSVLGGEEVDSLNDRNRAAAERLAQKGVRVFFEDAPALLHAKAVLVDGTAALLGSSNWSAKSWTENIETNLLLREPAVLRPLAAYLGQIPRTPYVPDAAVRLPASLLASPAGLGLMSRRRAENAFDLYLWLLKESQAPGATGPVRV